MSYYAASSRGRGGPSVRPAVQREPPRMPEDRDATVSHGVRRGGLGLPPLVLSSSRGRGRGGAYYGRGRGAMTGSNTYGPRGGDSGWGSSLPPRPPPPSRPVDTYIPPRPRPRSRSKSPPAVHERWDSPPESRNGRYDAGPSNYTRPSPPPAARPPPPAAGTSSSVDRLAKEEPVSTGPIVPMKFKPKMPKPRAPIRPAERSTPNPEETVMNGDSATNSGQGRPRSKSAFPPSNRTVDTPRTQDVGHRAGPSRPSPPPPRQPIDEKEDIAVEEEEDVKPDLAAVQAAAASSSMERQDGGTIDPNRNDGVLVMWPHQIPECFPPNKPPGRTKARHEWRSAREAELKVKGIKVVRALWRDDGVGLHWERLAQPRAKVKAVPAPEPTPATDNPIRATTPPPPAVTAGRPPSPMIASLPDLDDKSEIVVAPDPDARRPKSKTATPKKVKVKAEPGSEMSRTKRKALKKKEKRKREQAEAEEASMNGQDTPVKKKKKDKGEEKKDQAAELAKPTSNGDVKKEEKRKDKKVVSSQQLGSPSKPSILDLGQSSSSIDPPKPKRLISIADNKVPSSVPISASSSFTLCPPPEPMRISDRRSPDKAPSSSSTVRPVSTAPARPPSSIPHPIKPYQGPTSISNPIKPYQPPSTTASRSSPPAHAHASPPTQQPISKDAARPLRPIPTGPRADSRPQISRSVTPSNVSTRFDELKRSLRAKMVEMDNWTSMLSDMPDTAELTQRQIDRTRAECFDLQKQMRDERERTGQT